MEDKYSAMGDHRSSVESGSASTDALR